VTVKSSHYDYKGKTLVFLQRERYIKRHPTLDQVKAVDQVGVPGKFPALSLRADMDGEFWVSSAAAIAASPTSPRRPTIASICASFAGAGIGNPSIDVTDIARLATLSHD
jgi:hypothetical protein